MTPSDHCLTQCHISCECCVLQFWLQKDINLSTLVGMKVATLVSIIIIFLIHLILKFLWYLYVYAELLISVLKMCLTYMSWHKSKWSDRIEFSNFICKCKCKVCDNCQTQTNVRRQCLIAVRHVSCKVLCQQITFSYVFMTTTKLSINGVGTWFLHDLVSWVYSSWRQPLRVDGPKASQRSIITYEIHFCTDQVKTHQEVRFWFDLSYDATKVHGQMLRIKFCCFLFVFCRKVLPWDRVYKMARSKTRDT